jgi:hypothetical protein
MTPNPSLHPKCYRGLRPLAHSGVLKRWAAVTYRHPSAQRQLLLAVLAALGLHVLLVWLLIGRAVSVGESAVPSHRLAVRLLKPAVTQVAPTVSDPPMGSSARSRRVVPSPPVTTPAQSASPGAEPAVPAPIDATTEQAATADVPAASSLRLEGSVLGSAATQSKGAVRLLAEASGSELPISQVAVVAQLEAAVAHSAKPSCLAANPMGSLLSLPLIALAAMTSQCK